MGDARPFRCTACGATWSAAEMLGIFFRSVRAVADECLCGGRVIDTRAEPVARPTPKEGRDGE